MWGFRWCGQRNIPKVPILLSGFPQTIRNRPESRTFRFLKLSPPKPHSKSVPSKMMWILLLRSPKLAPSSPTLLYLRILSIEYYKTHSIMWKNGAVPMTWLLWSLYGHCGWDPLEACIVKTLRAWKKCTFLIRLKYFITRKTKSIPFSLNEVIKYVPKLFQSVYAELAASCVIWEPRLLPMKTEKFRKTSLPWEPNQALSFFANLSVTQYFLTNN